MTDYCLKFSNAAAAHNALSSVLPGYSEGRTAYRGLWAVDRIGTLYEPHTETDGEITTGAALPGYHVNLRVDDSLTQTCDAALAAFTVVPATPQRVWA